MCNNLYYQLSSIIIEVFLDLRPSKRNFGECHCMSFTLCRCDCASKIHSWLQCMYLFLSFSPFFKFLRQPHPWLPWIFLCRPGWSRTYRDTPAYVSYVALKGVHHHTWPKLLFFFKGLTGASGMAQKVKLPATKYNTLSLMPSAQMVEREWTPKSVLWSSHYTPTINKCKTNVKI